MSTAATHIGFRPDIEGLRAIAVLMVLLYHLDVYWLEGGFAGVDVFFVISGYLITRLLLKEQERTGRVSLVNFYARRVRRLLPAAGVVLVATAVMAWLWLPRIRWGETGGDIIAASIYLVNWWFAARSVDYLAEDVQPSLVQHFWSLSIEEQFYFVWPLLLILGFQLARRVGIPGRASVGGLLVALGVASFLHSVKLTEADQALAYFHTTTRVWELAAGAGVALSAAWWSRLPPLVAVVMGWVGLAAIGLTALGIGVDVAAWPGYAAVLPVAGTAAVIAAGHVPDRRGPVVVLGLAVMVWVGALSYSIYLWHWPLAELARLRYDGIDIPIGLAVAALSIGLSWLTYHLVENPARRSRTLSAQPWFSLAAGANLTLAGVVAGLVLIAVVSAQRPAVDAVQAGAALDRLPPGARILGDEPRGDPRGVPVDQAARIVPDPLDATRDVPRLYEEGCQVQFTDPEPRTCYFGAADGAMTIAIVGDSKVAQWQPALDVLADRNGWRIQTNVKSSCGFHSAMLVYDGAEYDACHQWNRATLEVLLQTRPDFVLVSHGRSVTGGGGDGDQSLAPALIDWWSRLEQADIKVIALADNPHPGQARVYECVEENRERLTACAFPFREGGGTPSLRAAARSSGVPFIDLTDAICPSDQCPAVIGDVLLYRQGSHLTASYIVTMAERLERELKRAGVP